MFLKGQRETSDVENAEQMKQLYIKKTEKTYFTMVIMTD